MAGYIGIDLGGTKIRGVLLDEAGRERASVLLPALASAGETAVCRQLFSAVDEMLAAGRRENCEAGSIGVAVPGALRRAEGILSYAANLPLREFPLAQIFQDKYLLPVALENDANAAALAEYHLGAGRGSSNMLYVTVSTGIGAGAVLAGRLYRGSTGNALELGHITIAKDGLPCACGNHGCAELYASGTAVVSRMRAAIAAGRMTSLQPESLTAEQVFAAAAAGDALGQEITRQVLQDLGTILSVAAGLFDPDVIVVGGGMAAVGEPLLASSARVLRQRCLGPVAEHLQLRPAQLGDRGGAYGAALLPRGEDKFNKTGDGF